MARWLAEAGARPAVGCGRAVAAEGRETPVCVREAEAAPLRGLRRERHRRAGG